MPMPGRQNGPAADVGFVILIDRVDLRVSRMPMLMPKLALGPRGFAAGV